MSLPGYATPEGTEQYSQTFRDGLATDAYRTLGKTGLVSSTLGFGTYRCVQESEAHASALQFALKNGCNLIDTSANYGDGSAEALIGEVLNQEIVWDGQPREAFIVVSKAGYIQGENFQIALKREESGDPFPDVVKYQHGLWHCIHPEFLEDQITRSLARMHLDTLDIYLLHNPEYFLLDAARRQLNRADAERMFYDRIRQAFLELEKLADEGLIRYYGISSNGFPSNRQSADYVSLAKICRIYEDVCLQRGILPDQGRFAAIQLPLNWIEYDGARLKNNDFRQQKATVLEVAKAHGLAVLLNRPLNAIHENHLVRLATYPHIPAIDPEFQARLEAFDAAFPTMADKLTASQKAFKILQQTDGTDVILCGMRQVDYVKDALGILTDNETLDVDLLFKEK